MNDSVRETFEQDYEELHGIAVPESSFKRDETGNYYDPDIAREWIIWSAAWRANGGEADRLRKELADMKRVFNTAMEVANFPDAHPAPPSVAVPEGWIPFPTEAWLFLTGEGPLAGRHFGDIVCDDKTGRDKPFWWRSHIRHMLTAAPSPDHIADAGKVVPDDAILARAWYHAGEDGDYNIYDALNADCPDCVEVLIVRADAARLRTAGDEGEGV